ncbi:MAG: hypothetical protein LAT83_22055 [Kiritimatiellae bacterium]|nr:hypothetical protein [Kiritimatiellia bacterium]
MPHPIAAGLLLVLAFGCARKDTAPEWPEPETLPAIQARVTEDSPRVGDVVDVELRISADERLQLPAWRELLHDQVRLLNHQTPAGSADEDGIWRQKANLQVALYSVTNVTLFAENRVRTRDEPPVDIDLPHHTFTVTPLLADDDAVPNPGNMELMDFRGPEAIRRFRRNLLFSLIGFIALALTLWFVLRKLREDNAPPPPLPKWDHIALRKMRELRHSPLWESGDADGSAVALSAILREYIENRFKIHAPELTTEEFLQEAAERQPWSDEDQTELIGFFTAVDRIKFAAERPGREALDALMQAAERFVLVTGESEVST